MNKFLLVFLNCILCVEVRLGLKVLFSGLPALEYAIFIITVRSLLLKSVISVGSASLCIIVIPRIGYVNKVRPV